MDETCRIGDLGHRITAEYLQQVEVFGPGPQGDDVERGAAAVRLAAFDKPARDPHDGWMVQPVQRLEHRPIDERTMPADQPLELTACGDVTGVAQGVDKPHQQGR